LANPDIYCENELKRRGYDDYKSSIEFKVQIAYSSSRQLNDDEFEEYENANYEAGMTRMTFTCNSILLGETIYMPLAPVENYFYDKSGNRWKVDQSTVRANKWNTRDCKKISDKLYINESGSLQKLFLPKAKIWVVRRNKYIRKYTPIKYQFKKPNF